MIEFQQGDILRAKTDALVNTVNCVGVMGRGIALQFKKAFPEMLKAYESACRRGEVQPSKAQSHRHPPRPETPRLSSSTWAMSSA